MLSIAAQTRQRLTLILRFDIRRRRHRTTGGAGGRRSRRHTNMAVAAPVPKLQKRVDAVDDRRRQCKELHNTTAPTNLGPDLPNILRQSYDNAEVTIDLWTDV